MVTNIRARGGPDVTGKVFLKNLAEKASPGSAGSGIVSAPGRVLEIRVVPNSC